MTGDRRTLRLQTAIAWTLLAGAVAGGWLLDHRNRSANFGVDAAVYTQMGLRLAEGAPDAFALGTVAPGVPLAIACLHKVGLSIEAAARTVAFASHAGLALAIFALARRASRAAGAAEGPAALASAAVAAVFANTLYNLTTAVNPLTDHPSVGLLVVSAALLGAPDPSRGRILAIGATAAFAYFSRYLALPLTAVILGIAAWRIVRDGAKTAARRGGLLALLAAPLVVLIGVSAWFLSRGGYDGVTGAGLHASTQAPLAAALDSGAVRTVHESTTCVNADATISVWRTAPESPLAWNLYHWTAVRGPVEGFDAAARLGGRLARLGPIAGDGWRSLRNTLPLSALLASLCAWAWLVASRRMRGFGDPALALLVATAAAAAGGALYGFYEPRYLWVVTAFLLAGLAAAAAALTTDVLAGRRRAAAAALPLALALCAALVSSARDAAGLGFGPSRRAEGETDRWIRERIVELVPAGGRVVSKYPGHVLPGDRIWLPLPTLTFDADGRRGLDFARFEAFTVRGGAAAVVLAGKDAAPGQLAAPLGASDLPPGWTLLAELPGRARIVARTAARR